MSVDSNRYKSKSANNCDDDNQRERNPILERVTYDFIIVAHTKLYRHVLMANLHDVFHLYNPRQSVDLEYKHCYYIKDLLLFYSMVKKYVIVNQMPFLEYPLKSDEATEARE